MSIFSDHDVGALSDKDFECECIRMNNRDKIEKEELERLYHDEDSEGGLVNED